MNGIRVSDNIVPVSELKTRAAEWLERIKNGETVVITQNGKAAGVVVSPATYDELAERRRFVAAVEQGLADFEEGRTVPHAGVVAESQKRYGGTRK